MSQPDFYTILDECVARQRHGEALETCLADYPEQAAELSPVLAVSADLYQLPRLEPAPDIVTHGYKAIMGALAARERPSWLAGITSLVGKLLSPLKPQKTGRLTFVLRVAMLLLAFMVVSSAFAITASANSLPGDVLYPVKRSWENTRLALTLTEPSRQALESEFAKQRREEVQAVLELRRPVIVEFQGRLQSAADDVWLVDGLSVAVNDGTRISGAIIIGQQVYIRARVQTDGLLIALQIAGDESDSPGTIVPTDEPRPTDEKLPTREAQPTSEPTQTRERIERLTRRPTQGVTATLEPMQEPIATRQFTKTPEPTATHEPTATRVPELNNDRVTLTPEDRPTPTDKPTNGTGSSTEPTRDTKPTPEPTATREREKENKPTATHEPRPTATKAIDSGGGSDRPNAVN